MHLNVAPTLQGVVGQRRTVGSEVLEASLTGRPVCVLLIA